MIDPLRRQLREAKELWRHTHDKDAWMAVIAVLLIGYGLSVFLLRIFPRP